MTDDLRTRIAAALTGDHCVQGMTAPCDDCCAHALRQADAVIRNFHVVERTLPLEDFDE